METAEAFNELDAADYLVDHHEGNAFLTSLWTQLQTKGRLSPKQLAAVERNAKRPAPKPKTDPVTEPGVYEVEGVIYVVKPTRDKSRLYAKRLIEINAERSAETGERVQIEFEYERGAIYKLSPEHRMPLAKAKALTIRYGRCIVCGKRLKAAESVERGIGPVCIRSFRS